MAVTRAILKPIFRFFFWLTQNLVRSIEDIHIPKLLKSLWSEIQDGPDGRHLENLFCASSPDPRSQSTLNLVGSIRVTCRSKIAKIVPIQNQIWPPWRSSKNLYFASSQKLKGKLTRNLVGSIWETCRSTWKSIFRFFSWTERPNDSKLSRNW